MSPEIKKDVINDEGERRVHLTLSTGADEQATVSEYPRVVLNEFNKRGLPLDDCSLCEVLPGTRAYKGVAAYAARVLQLGSYAVDRFSESGGCREDEDLTDCLGEWLEAERNAIEGSFKSMAKAAREESSTKNSKNGGNTKNVSVVKGRANKGTGNNVTEKSKGKKSGDRGKIVNGVSKDDKEQGKQESSSKSTSDFMRTAAAIVRSRKVGPAPRARLVLGLGVFTKHIKGRTLYIAHFSRGLPVSSCEGPRTYRGMLLGVEGKDRASAQFLQDFIQASVNWRRKDLQPTANPGKFVLYRYKVTDKAGYWQNDGMKRGRPVESVILPKKLRDEIVRDFEDFLAPDTKKWYTSRGLPHRRAFLFYGPPGVGKSSMIRALAGMYQLNACFLAMANPEFNNELLGDALQDCPANALLVLEDIDCLFEDRKATKGVALTFSGFLNALDGMVSTDGRVTIMTTNHLEKLDPALIRCGRVDRRFEFAPPVKQQIEEMFQTYYSSAPKHLSKEFVKAVFNREEDEARSIATLQQFFILCRHNTAEDALKRIGEFFKSFFPNGPKRKNPLYI